MHLPEVLAVGDRDDDVEMLELAAAAVAARVPGVDERMADRAHANARSEWIAHGALIGSGGFLDGQRHRTRTLPGQCEVSRIQPVEMIDDLARGVGDIDPRMSLVRLGPVVT